MSAPVPFVDLERIHSQLAPALEAAYRRVLASGSFIQGREVDAFEKEWSEFCGVPHTVGCANGTDAIMLILLALGIGPGDEVITVSNTFFATIEAIAAVGASPVMVDVNPHDGLIDVKAAEAAITSRTKAIIAVHLYGLPCDLAALKRLTDSRGLFLIEDAAQAHGALYKGAHVGGLGVASSFSFFPGKNLGALGDAGAVVTRDQGLADTLRSLRNHGRGPQEKYSHSVVGYNMRMDALQAAFLRVKLPHLAGWVDERRSIAHIYDEGFRNLPSVTPIRSSDQVSPAYHLYVILNNQREELARMLGQRGIGTGMHYPLGCHEQPGWKARHPPVRLQHTEHICRSCISLPMFGAMREEEAHTVVKSVRELCS